ncbi:hypothetical protein QTO34_017260 [Cnephaeus nilssonii]|uniref:cGMP-dependent protein kinase interacting domain-containing protein n=1 Tax=Cnephaeus nilssonii TaxID=3371016 RepID=A0AA40I1H2_CNENI|nr:hypothetical protein QTO34_017260 [Eptesicus nilssonii]
MISFMPDPGRGSGGACARPPPSAALPDPGRGSGRRPRTAASIGCPPGPGPWVREAPAHGRLHRLPSRTRSVGPGGARAWPPRSADLRDPGPGSGRSPRTAASIGCPPGPGPWVWEEPAHGRLHRLPSATRALKVELERTTQRKERFAERPALLELERFEHRALERKAAELKEELKGLSNLRADNQHLKEENTALICLIIKLSK